MSVRVCDLTFEDDLQLVSQDVKGAVSGAGLWNDVLFEPASTGILVEVVTWIHGGVHVLDETRRCMDRNETPFENWKRLAGYYMSLDLWEW